jgi:hypothetical protein
VKLLKDEIVTIQILRLPGETNQAIAIAVGIENLPGHSHNHNVLTPVLDPAAVSIDPQNFQGQMKMPLNFEQVN